MHSRCLLQLLLALFALLLSKAQDVMGSSISCVKSRPTDDGHTRVTFLREDKAVGRTLYFTWWSEDVKLLACEINPNPFITVRYHVLCREGNTNGQDIVQRFNLSAALYPDAPCALGSSGLQKFSRREEIDGREARTRRKRGVLFPGTLWCGTGSKAKEYDQLGMFESADKCCREHDHCEHIIQSFSLNYGVFNSKFFTVSHCDCDQRFRQCLLGVNDTISSMVGYSFFNILQVPCFELKQQKRCTEMYWCKVASVAPYAVFKTSLPYNSSDVTSKYNADSNKVIINQEQYGTESPVISTKFPRTEHRCSSREPPRGDTFHRNRKNGRGCHRNQKLSTAAPTHKQTMSNIRTTTPSRTVHVFIRSTLSPNKRAGKKKNTRDHTSTSSPHKSQDHLHMTTTSYAQTSSTSQRTPLLFQKPPLQPLVQTATTGGAKNIKRHRKGPNHRHCCRDRKPLRGDAFVPNCKKRCKGRKQNRRTHTTVTPSATTLGFRVKPTKFSKFQQTKTDEIDKQETLKAHPRGTKSTNQDPASSVHMFGEQRKLNGFQLLSNSTNQESKGTARTLHTPAEKSLTDNQLICERLKYLDNCLYKIPPLEMKYGLQNNESKMVYHCDCTSRLALQIESFSQAGILPTLIMDSVSQICLKLPKEKKCHNNTSCSGGFTKASDLLQALKKIEEKDTARVQNSVNERKRGIPVRLSKRCFRLQKEADFKANLTRL